MTKIRKSIIEHKKDLMLRFTIERLVHLDYARKLHKQNKNSIYNILSVKDYLVWRQYKNPYVEELI